MQVSSTLIESLEPISATLLAPLWARAAEARKRSAILTDWHAVATAAALDFDFDALRLSHTTMVGVCARTAIIDGMVRSCCAAAPRLLLVNVGEGLDNRLGRVDNGAMSCVDLDLPSVTRMRSLLVPPSPRRRLLSHNVLDMRWAEEIGKPETVLLVAEGVLTYLPKDRVQMLFAEIERRFPGASIIFDTVTPAVAKVGARLELGHRFPARYLWGLSQTREVESWGGGYQLLERQSILGTFAPRFGLGVRLLASVLPAIRSAHVVNRVQLGVKT